MNPSNPLPAADAAADIWAQEQSAGCGDTSFFAYRAFLAGHAWTLQHLSEQGAEFDEEAALKQHRTYDTSDMAWGELAGFVAGARWQHAQSQLVIQALSRNNLALGEEIAGLRAQLEAAAVAPPIATNTGWPHEKALHKEIERLRFDLHEATKRADERNATVLQLEAKLAEAADKMLLAEKYDALTDKYVAARAALERIADPTKFTNDCCGCDPANTCSRESGDAFFEIASAALAGEGK